MTGNLALSTFTTKRVRRSLYPRDREREREEREREMERASETVELLQDGVSDRDRERVYLVVDHAIGIEELVTSGSPLLALFADVLGLLCHADGCGLLRVVLGTANLAQRRERLLEKVEGVHLQSVSC